MSMSALLTIAFGAILAENIVFTKLIGICPFLSVTKRMDLSVGMGLAVTVITGVSSIAAWAVNNFLLVRFGVEYLQAFVFILAIIVIAKLIELFLQKFIPALSSSLGIFLPVVTTNCAVLGVILIMARQGYGLLGAFVYGLCAGIGFTVALLLFAAFRQRLEDCEYPKSFEGFPIVLVAASLLAMAFTGFQGLHF